MKKLTILSVLLLFAATFKTVAQTADVDSLKQQVALAPNDTVKADLYRQIAGYYLNYNILLSKKLKRRYQDNAIYFTIQAIHAYSRYNDTTGLRNSFDNLVTIYKDQKKYSPAKWFVLQSNTLSRQQNDVPHIISSLIQLAGIKMAIKDYSLAMRDLNEALALSAKNHIPQQESAVQQTYALLYTKLNDPKKASIAQKRHDLIDDSIIRTEEARVARLKAQDSTESKKKLYTSTAKKAYRTGSYKKAVSLSY